MERTSNKGGGPITRSPDVRTPGSAGFIRRVTLVLISLLEIAIQTPAMALDINWNGSFNDSWHSNFNWDPFNPPGTFRRVPGDGDRAILSTPANDIVRLNAHTEHIDGLQISNGIDLDTNGFMLTVDDAGSGMAGIFFTGSALFVRARADDPVNVAFDADAVVVSSAALQVFGVAQVDGLLEVGGTGSVNVTNGSLTVGQLTMAATTFSDNIFRVAGPAAAFHSTGANDNTIGTRGNVLFTADTGAQVQFDGDLAIGFTTGDTQFRLFSGAKVFTQSIFLAGQASSVDVRIDVDGSNSNIIQQGASTLTIGSTTGTAVVKLTNRGVFTPGTGQTTINKTGVLELATSGSGGGTFVATGDVVVDGGMLTESAMSNFGLVLGGDLTVQNGGTVILNNHLELFDQSNLMVTNIHFAVNFGGLTDLARISWSSFKVINKLNTGEPNHAFGTI